MKPNKAFTLVKKVIIEWPILVNLDPKKPYKVETDALGFALEGQLE